MSVRADGFEAYERKPRRSRLADDVMTASVTDRGCLLLNTGATRALGTPSALRVSVKRSPRALALHAATADDAAAFPTHRGQRTARISIVSLLRELGLPVDNGRYPVVQQGDALVVDLEASL